MARNRIVGITIEIDGDTTQLTKALSGVNKDLKNTQDSLNDVNKLLKMDPSNVNLLKQKQDLLNRAIQDTKSKLDTEKQALAQLKSSDQTPEVKDRQAALEREIAATEQSLKGLKKEMSDFGSVSKQQLEATSQKFGDLAQKTRGASMAAAGLATALIGNAVNAAQTADELNTLSAQYGVSTDEIQKMNYAQDLVDVSTETMLGSIQRLTKAMGEENAAFETLGIETTNADGSMRDATDVWYEALEALSQVGNETERDQLAMEIFGKSAVELTGIVDDGGAALKALGEEAEASGAILSEDALKSANEFNDGMDRLKARASSAFLEAGAALAEALLPALEKLIGVVSKVLEWFANLDGTTQTVILTVLGLVAAISPLMSVLSALTSPMGLVIAGIGALIAAGVALYQNWDVIKEKASEVWESITTSLSETWTSIKGFFSNIWSWIDDNILHPITDAWESIKGFFSDIKEALSNFEIKLPKIALPHFNVSGGKFPWGIAGEGWPPTFSVDWYAKAMNNGMILDQPTIFGAANGKLLGGGEAGREAIIGVNSLESIIQRAVSAGGATSVTNNFEIRSTDPRQAALEVANILQQQTDRRAATWS